MGVILKNEALEHVSKHVTAWHSHLCGQVYWLKSGMIAIETEHEQWALTPGAIGWLPPGCRHKATVFGEMKGWSLHLSAGLSQSLPNEPRLGAADAFLSALVERISAFGTAALQPPQRRMLAVLMDEIACAPKQALQLVLPQDRRALEVASLLMEHPATPLGQEELAARAGMSVRTLRRLFSEETGLAFSRWRQQARVLRSLAFLVRGESVGNVANACGYENVSAYIAAFKQRFGVTPGSYFESGTYGGDEQNLE